MANQAIALGIRGPQVPDLARVNQQYGQIMNMMSQQRAAERQAAQAQQAMDIAAAKEGRELDLHGPAMAEAQSKATAADIKTGLDFNNFVRIAIANSSTPEQVEMFAERIAGIPQFQTPLYQGVLQDALEGMPRDPAQFGPWRKETYLGTLEADKRYETQLQRIQSGGEEFTVAVSNLSPEAGAMEVPGTRTKIPEGIQYIKDDQGNVYAVPKTTGGGGGGAPVGGGTADVVYGFGKFAKPPKPISSMTIGEVQNFQKNELIPATRGKVGAGPDKGTGAVGTYQIVYNTLKDYAPKVLGPNWRNTPFTADVQDRIAKAIYEDVKDGNLKDTWAGLPNNRPGAYSNVPWEEVRGQIAKVESGGGGAAGGGRGGPTPVIAGSGDKDAQKTTEDERKISSNVRLAASAAREMAKVVREDPSGIAPGTGEYIAGQLPFYGEEASKFAQSGPRQRFDAALAKFLLAAQYITTGAGVAAPQMKDLRAAFFPTYQDTERSRQTKLLGALQFIRDAKDRAGSLWTPELEAELNTLEKLFRDPATYRVGAKPKPATPTKGPKAKPGSGWGKAEVVGD